MLSRLAALALAASLSLFSSSSAEARTFASAPPGAPVAGIMLAPEDAPPTLSPAMRARLKRVLAARRAKNLAAFRAYARRGVYPHNFEQPGALNVWIDQEGRMCAAATMIFRSGAKALVRAIGRDDNFIRLGDVTSGPVLDWILTSGLTQDEVATIQEPFMRVQPGPEPAPAPIIVEPAPPTWTRAQEDQRLAARYREVLRILAAGQRDALEAAIDRLATRPDLVATLVP